MFQLLYNLLDYSLLAYLSTSAIYLFVFAVAALLYKQKKTSAPDKLPKISVLIPAYKADEVIIASTLNSLYQNYPKELFDVLVIADGLKSETIECLYTAGADVLEVSFEKSTKVKALQAAITHQSHNYDMVVVLDADNFMEANFLQEVAQDYQAGKNIIQGKRIAKNLDTPVAVLDAISEGINFEIYNAGPRVLNLSARLAGSGMAFDYQLFSAYISKCEAVGGFDKELELLFTSKGQCIHYNEKAIILDEKVQSGAIYQNQRKRWIAAQFHYLTLHFIPAVKALFQDKKFDYFNKTLQMALPPRLLIPVLLATGSGLNVILGSSTALFWMACLAANVLANLISAPKKLLCTHFSAILKALPLLVYSTLKATISLKGANKTFIHTPHKA